MRHLIMMIILGCPISLSAQNNYIQYYQSLNEAKKLETEKKLDSSLIVYEYAFSQVDFIHSLYLQKAIKIGKKTKNKTLVNKYSEILGNRKKTINNNLKNTIDSIGIQDQRIRGARYEKAKLYYYKCLYDTSMTIDQTKLDKSKILMKDWWRTDSSNILTLKQIINKQGFPGEKLVGMESYNTAMVIILHYDRDTSNTIMGDILYKALLEGNLLPNDYAWIIDRHLVAAGKKQKYMSIPLGIENLSKIEKEEINRNRKAIGLEPLGEVKIIKKGNSVIVKTGN